MQYAYIYRAFINTLLIILYAYHYTMDDLFLFKSVCYFVLSNGPKECMLCSFYHSSHNSRRRISLVSVPCLSSVRLVSRFGNLFVA